MSTAHPPGPTRRTVRRWAEALLPQLGMSGAYELDVTGPGFGPGDSAEPARAAPGGPAFATSLRVDRDEAESGGPGPDADGPEVSTGLLVSLTLADGSPVFAHLSQPLPEPDALVLLAGQLQDGLLEHTGGAPLPACPGHPHPATAQVVDGTPCWVCPRGDTTAPDSVRPVLPDRTD